MLKPDTEFYAEWDEETATYCVFDTEDGKAWSSWASLEQAEKDAEEREERHKEAMGIPTAYQIIKIFKEAENKRFTYLYLETPLGLYMSPVIENLDIQEITDEKIYLAGAKGHVDEFVTVPLNDIDSIEKIDPKNYRLEDADSEYLITYEDGTELYVQIVYEFEM